MENSCERIVIEQERGEESIRLELEIEHSDGNRLVREEDWKALLSVLLNAGEQEPGEQEQEVTDFGESISQIPQGGGC